MEYKFEDIAYNSTAKKLPIEADKDCYIGLEHLDSDCLSVTRWGAETAPIGEKLIMKKGDVLFGKRRAYQRKVGIAPFDGIFSAHGMVLRPKEEVIDKDFFPFFISSDQFMERAVRISVGGLSPTINWKDLKIQKFSLPALEEQRELAKKLWAAYRLKESYKKLLAATSEMVKSQFIEMFKDSHKVGLGQLATFINGSAFKPEDWSTEGLPIVRIQNLNDTSCEYNFYNGDCSKKIVIDNGDVLVSWSATLGVFIWDKGKALLNQHIFKVVFDKIEIDRDFFIYTVSVALDKMSQHTHGSTMKHIVKSEFNKFPVACPTLSEQKEFAQIAQQADKSEFELRKSIESIDAVIKSLINS